MEKYMCAYKVEVCYEGNYCYEYGIVPATSYTDAMGQIEDYYGDELCTIEHMELLDVSMLTMNEELWRKVIEQL